jgi:hypothetical protein
MEQQVPVNFLVLELEPRSPAISFKVRALDQTFQIGLVPSDYEAVTVLRNVLVYVPGRVLADVSVAILPAFAFDDQTGAGAKRNG